MLYQGAEGLRIEFDRQCSTEKRHDPLTIMDGSGRTMSVRSGKSVDSLHFVLFFTSCLSRCPRCFKKRVKRQNGGLMGG